MAAMFSKDEIFQLTPSRRATEQLLAENEQLIISTHALTEGDRVLDLSGFAGMKFQPTPSRRATMLHGMTAANVEISTHALTEGDKKINEIINGWNHFNSRPHGGRLQI